MFDVGWDDPVPSSCSFGFDHYEVCWNWETSGTPSPSAPSSPGAADRCADVGGPATKTTAVVPTHRSDRRHAMALFACDDADCTNTYGDASYSATLTGQTKTDADTDKECYVLTDITARDDDDRFISTSSYNGVQAVDALFYPLGFTKANYLGVWFSWADATTSVRRVTHRVAGASGWQDFNTYSSWTDTLVAEGTGGSGAYGQVTHPWVIPEDDGGTRRIRLYFQAYPSSASDSEIARLRSVDDVGDDFGTQCDTGGGCDDGCAYGDNCYFGGALTAVDADGDTGDEYVDMAGHGRAMWDPVAHGGVDFDGDTPSMVFTGEPDGSTCLDPGSGVQPDIYRVDWSGSAWSVVGDGGSPECPLEQPEDEHDPAILPLTHDDYRMITQDESTVVLRHWNGVDEEWEDFTTDIWVCLDPGDTSNPCDDPATDCVAFEGDCMEDFAFVHYVNGATKETGLFFRAHKDGYDWGSPGVDPLCESGEGLDSGETPGVVFAERWN